MLVLNKLKHHITYKDKQIATLNEIILQLTKK